MASISGWRALTDEGEWLEKVPACQVGFPRLQEFLAQMQGGGTIRIAVDNTKGEQGMIFTRHRVSANGGSARAEMPVFEVRFDDGRFVRLYLHPVLGPTLTTKDLEL